MPRGMLGSRTLGTYQKGYEQIYWPRFSLGSGVEACDPRMGSTSRLFRVVLLWISTSLCLSCFLYVIIKVIQTRIQI